MALSPHYRDSPNPTATGGAYRTPKPPKLRKLRPFGTKQTKVGYGYQAPGALGNKPLTSLKPAPAATAASAGPVDPLPIDPQYIQDTGVLGKNWGDAQAAYTYGNTGVDQKYGFKSSLDAAGNVTGISVDPSNPYSLANALQKSYDNARRMGTNSYAAQGQLYSGAAQHAQDVAGDAYQSGYNTLAGNYAGEKHNLYSGLQSARDTFTTGGTQAYLDSVTRAQASPYAQLPVGKAGAKAAGGPAGSGGKAAKGSKASKSGGAGGITRGRKPPAELGGIVRERPRRRDRQTGVAYGQRPKPRPRKGK